MPSRPSSPAPPRPSSRHSMPPPEDLLLQADGYEIARHESARRRRVLEAVRNESEMEVAIQRNDVEEREEDMKREIRALRKHYQRLTEDVGRALRLHNVAGEQVVERLVEYRLWRGNIGA
eukprot:Hpha_TRINITY_DN5752_c0_g2::TRINITY_DN5752_c0_g2_i1::g.147664::m.147664